MSHKGKISIIIPYFGRWPAWMDYFLLSCRYNPDITWLFFSDCPPPDTGAGNIRMIPFSLNDFNRLAGRKLGIPLEIKHPYKLCDLKPAYGDIFEEYISDSGFWGYGDLDLVYGNIGKLLHEKTLNAYDIVSNHPDFVTGHFCILRNTPEIRSLYRSGGAYTDAFLDENYTGFDEKIKRMRIRPDPRYMGFMKRLDLSAHILITSFINACKKINPVKMRHGKKEHRKTGLPDFTSIVKNAEAAKKIRVHYDKTFQSDLMLRKSGGKGWEIKWEKGDLSNTSDGKQLLYFHFILSKARKSFKIDRFKQDLQLFTISRSGIKTDVKK